MDEEDDGRGLRRALGLPSLTFYGVGLILGAGIYSILGAAAGEAGNGLWLALVLGAGIALLTGMSYAELAAMMPKAGAEYTYAQEAFPRRPWVASATGYTLLVAGLATAATVAASFGAYVRVFLDVPAWVPALGLLALVTAVGIMGIRQSTWLNVTMTLVTVTGLALVVWLGFRHGDVRSAAGVAPPVGLVGAGAVVFFAYLGFEDLANLTEEARRPGRNVPRAILLSVAITATLYALVGVAAVALVGADALADSDAPLSEAAASVSPRHGTTLAAVALAATASTALITVVALSRMVLALARGGHAPRALGSLQPRRRTPWVATLAVLVGSAAFLPLGDVHALGAVASFSTLLAFSMVNLVVVRLRYTQPEAERPFRVPGRVGRLPVVPLLGVLGTLAFASQLGWPALALGSGLLVASLVAATFVDRRQRRGAAGPA